MTTEERAAALYELFNRRTLEEAERLIAPDHEWSIASRGARLREPARFTDAMRGWIEAFSNIRVEIVNVIAAGDSAVVEYIAHGTHDGNLPMALGAIGPTGRHLSLPLTDIHQFEDGRLRRTRTYYDGSALLAQLGVPAGASVEDQNKEAMRQLFEIFNTGRLDLAERVMSYDMVSHESFPGIPSGRGGFRLYIRMIRNAFPDLRMRILHLIAEGDTVVARVRMTGTHLTHFLDLPATGRSVDIIVVDIARFENGVAVEHWSYCDTAELMRQLGTTQLLVQGPTRSTQAS